MPPSPCSSRVMPAGLCPLPKNHGPDSLPSKDSLPAAPSLLLLHFHGSLNGYTESGFPPAGESCRQTRSNTRKTVFLHRKEAYDPLLLCLCQVKLCSLPSSTALATSVLLSKAGNCFSCGWQQDSHGRTHSARGRLAQDRLPKLASGLSVLAALSGAERR